MTVQGTAEMNSTNQIHQGSARLPLTADPRQEGMAQVG